MLRSMYSGIGGMRNFQTKLDVIGNNIANVNTFGFKKSRVTFKDIASQTLSGASSPTANLGGQNGMQVGLGSTIATIDTIHTSSSPQTTGRAQDLAIEGDGYFVVKNGNQEFYTRAGNFDFDSSGNLVAPGGYKVQGYPVVNGQLDTTQIGDIQLDRNAFMPPTATSFLTLAGNLDAATGIGTTTTYTPTWDATNKENTPKLAANQKSMDFKMRDSLGREHDFKMVASKTSDTEWNYQVFSVSKVAGEEGKLTEVAGSNGKLVFDSSGQLVLPTSQQPGNKSDIKAINFNPGGGAEALIIKADQLSFNNISQVAAATTLNVKEQDGFAEGYLNGFTISPTGEVSATFTNGKLQVVSQIVLANFSNPSGLMKSGNNLFARSNNSGNQQYSIAGNGVGAIKAGALEMSNVDLSEEFTEMIVSQRGFQANSRIITTSDQILEELVNLKR
jgi:flagellar hook protein FlgE